MSNAGLPERTGLLVALGAGFWLAAALALRAAEAAAPLSVGLRAAAYGAAVPALAVSLWVAQRIAGFPRAGAFGAVSVITMVALCLDGLAFGLVPGLYGVDPAHRLWAATMVLWGGGVGMVLAYLWSRGG